MRLCSNRLKSTRLALLILLGHLGTACTDQGSDALDDPSSGAVPTFQGTVDLEFGEIVGDGPYLFTRIESIVEDADGRLIVADLMSHEVRVFDHEGRFLFRFGGQGEGPGELTYPCCLAFGPNGLLWVRESTRYSAFRLDGASAQYARGQRIAHAGQGMVAPITFDAEGRLVDIGPSMNPEGASVMTRFHLGADGSMESVPMSDPDRQATGSTTVQRMFGETPVTMFVYQPAGPRWIHGHGPGGAWVEAISSEYLVTLHTPDGAASPIAGPQRPGPPLSPDERERAQARIDSEMERLDLDRHPFAVPDRKPPLADIFFDRSGRLWVERTGVDGEEMREADVYDGTALVARYRWPRRVRAGDVPWATESLLYGTTRDSLDVPRVVRVRFRAGL